MIMQELGKFNFKIKVIPNGLKIYMSFDISNKLGFTDGFEFTSSQFFFLVNNLGKDGLK